MLAELLDNERAADNCQTLREVLLARGFVQTNLTNFEQGRYRHRPERYQYEECSFRPDEYEMIGFGPSALSYSVAAILASVAIRANWETGLAVIGRDAPSELLHDIRENANAFLNM